MTSLRTWGPLTVLAVAVTLLIVIGGLVEVITSALTFRQFLDDVLVFVGSALALATGIGRGLEALGKNLR